jgi:hypothetical protein
MQCDRCGERIKESGLCNKCKIIIEIQVGVLDIDDISEIISVARKKYPGLKMFK